MKLTSKLAGALIIAAPLVACGSSSGTSVERFVKVAGSPSNVVAAGGSVWTVDRSSGDVLRIDPATRKVQATIDSGVSGSSLGGVGRLTARDGSVWVTGQNGSAIIDVATNTVKISTVKINTVTISAAAPGVAAGDAAYAVADSHLVELDPTTGEQRSVIDLPQESGSDVYIAGEPMVAVGDVIYLEYNGTISKTLGRFDTTTNMLTYLYPIGRYVSIAATADTVWLLEGDRKLTGYDTTIGDPIGPPVRLRVEGDFAGLDDNETSLVVADDGTMWAIDQPAQLLYRLDPNTGAVISTTKLTYRPSSLLVLDDQIWLNNTFDDRITVIQRADIQAEARPAS